jgi:hypothetical protein
MPALWPTRSGGLIRTSLPLPAGSAGPALSAPGSKKVAHQQEQHTTLARWQTAKYRAPSGPPALRIKTYDCPQYPSTEAAADHLVRPSMGNVSRMNTVAPLSLTAPKSKALAAFPCRWVMPALTRRPQKIASGEMRDSGVRGLLVYCQNYRCSHSTAISADRWPDDVRLSDIEPLFTPVRSAARSAPSSSLTLPMPLAPSPAWRWPDGPPRLSDAYWSRRAHFFRDGGLRRVWTSTECPANRHSRNGNLQQRSQPGACGRDRVVTGLQFFNSVEVPGRGGEKRAPGNPRSIEPKSGGSESKEGGQKLAH